MNPKLALQTVLTLQKQVRKCRETFSELFTGILGETLLQSAAHYESCIPRKTGEVVANGRIGPVEFGKAEYTSDALEDLLAMCGGLRAVLTRLERPEVPGEGVAEWELSSDR